MQPIVFLDKDGTLIENVPYNVDPARIHLTEKAPEGLAALHTAGYQLIVVTNQSGVARGYFPEKALLAVEDRLRALFEEVGVPLTGFYYCPHHPEGRVEGFNCVCECRKPAPGLILSAARNLGIDPKMCWMVGDRLDDIEAGRGAGCRTVLIEDSNAEERLAGEFRIPTPRNGPDRGG